MTTRFKSGQRGISFIGLVFVAVVLAATGVVLAQVFPTVLEYQAISKAVQKASEGNTVPEVRSIFDKATSIDAISSITGKDLEVTKEGDKVVVSFAYQREIPLFGPAYLTLKYNGRSR
jgi:sensor histidine kinase regulating citrate/malate metabolism